MRILLSPALPEGSCSSVTFNGKGVLWGCLHAIRDHLLMTRWPSAWLPFLCIETTIIKHVRHESGNH